jgi:hypothetical protein
MNRSPLIFILVKVIIVKLPRSGAVLSARQVDVSAADTPVFASFSMGKSYYLRRPAFVKLLLLQQMGLLMPWSALTNDGPPAV